jgi:hypothetical protein
MIFEEMTQTLLTKKSKETRAKHLNENPIYFFFLWELRGRIPNFHIHVSVSDSYIPTNDLPFLLQEICGPILGLYKLFTVEVGSEATQFP